MATALNLPLTFVENSVFREFLCDIGGIEDDDIPHCTKLRQELKHKYIEEQKAQAAELLTIPKISIAVDCWTSLNHLAQMGVTGNYITDDWKFREVLLGFEHIAGRDVGSRLSSVLMKCVKSEYLDISRQVQTITSDGAGNNGAMVRALASQLGREQPDFDPEARRLTCVTHMAQLVAKAIARALKISPAQSREAVSFDEDKIREHLQPGMTSTLLKVSLFILWFSCPPADGVVTIARLWPWHGLGHICGFHASLQTARLRSRGYGLAWVEAIYVVFMPPCRQRGYAHAVMVVSPQLTFD